jgi:hypothetical protein
MDSNDSCYDDESDDDEYSSDEQELDLKFIISRVMAGDYNPFLEAKIRQMSKRAMKGLEYALPTSLSSLRSCTNTDNSQSTGQGKEARVDSSDNDSKKSRRQNSGNSGNANNSRDVNEEGDDKEDNEFSGLNSNLDDGLLDSRRFACPFFQRDRLTYGHCKGCPGPGWKEVARLK